MAKTIKLDYEKVQISYTKLLEIYNETEAYHLVIKNATSFAEEEMKGRYGAGFKEVRKIILDDLKGSIKEIKDIAESIERATSDLHERDMVFSQTITK